MKTLTFQTGGIPFSLISFVRVFVQLSSMFIFKIFFPIKKKKKIKIFLVFNRFLKQTPKRFDGTDELSSPKQDH